MLVPFSYTLRSLFVRKSATLLTVLGIGATVAVLAGVLALRGGFTTLFISNGRTDVAVFLRQGAPSEGESGITRETADRLMKTLPQIATDAIGPEGGRPLAAQECYLAVRRRKRGGAGETNVPIRGVEPASFAIRGDDLRITEGRRLTPGADEVIIGRKLVDRIEGCAVGDVLQLNVMPFKVVGIFECAGPFESEIWGDFERMLVALERPIASRVVARLKPEVTGKSFDAFAEELENGTAWKDVKVRVMTERAYLESMTKQLSTALLALSIGLSVIMGLAATFTATNTMLAAIAGRTHEIGILLAVGFRPFPIFVSFMVEALLLGLLGGVVGCVLALPINGINTGTTNMQTFTEVAFAFRLTPSVLTSAVVFSLTLGLVGGAWPALRAARLTPTEALRRR